MNFLSQIPKRLAMVCWLALPLAGHAQSYKLDWSTIDAGGGRRTAGAYRLSGSVGQPVAGQSNGTRYRAQLGFWSGIEDEGQSPSELPDLRVSLVAASNSVVDGQALALSLLVSNQGPGTATGASATFVSGAGVTMATATPSTGNCTVTPSGVNWVIGTLAPGGSATVALSGVFTYAGLGLQNLQESGSSTSTASAGSQESDANPADNVASLVLSGFPQRDFGDASVPPSCLPDGARHRVVAGYSLGTLLDGEAGCQPNDDWTGILDEDGVTFSPPAPWLPGTVVTPTVTVSRSGGTPAFLDAWFDTNGTPGFDPADRLYATVSLPAIGPNVLPSFTVPASAPPSMTWIRFRLSQAGLTTPAGYGGTGEVEDYPVEIGSAVRPAVVLTSPANGSSFSQGSAIVLTASADAAAGKTIVSVEFFAGSNSLGTATSAPYTRVVTDLPLGPHVLTARALDNLGLTTTSEPVSISVIVSPCSGAVYTWNVGSGNWSVAGNWTTPAGTPTSPPDSDDTVNVNSGTVTVDTDVTVCRLNLGGGTISGSATLTVSDRLNWTAGSMAGTGRTVVGAGATMFLANSSDVTITGRTLENAGTVLWTGTADVLCDGSVITNQSGALWEARNNQMLRINGSGSGATPYFNNTGTFRKTAATGTTTFNLHYGIPFVFNNDGFIHLASGVLLYGGQFTNSGSVTVASGTILQMSGGGMASGSFANQAGGRVEWSGGTYPLVSGAVLNGLGVYSNSATVTVNTDVGVRYFDLTGTLNGSSTLTVSNVMNWTAGAMSGTGRTLIGAGATLNLANSGAVVISGRQLENAGTVLWTGTGRVNCDGAVITNRMGALWEARGNAALHIDPSGSGYTPYFHNAGTFRKAMGTGTTSFGTHYGFSFVFNNYHRVEVQSGTLQLQTGGTNSGQFEVASGRRLEWSGTTYHLDTGAQLNGMGVYSNAATLTVNTDVGVRNFDLAGTLRGTGTLVVSNVMNWTAGTMTDAGRTFIGPSGSLNIVNSNTVYLTYRTLDNAGTVLWTGAGNLECSSGVISNWPGALWEVNNHATFKFDGGGTTHYFNNAGTFRKALDTDTTTFTHYFVLNNYGVVDLQTGTLKLDSPFSQYSGETGLCSGNISNALTLEIMGGLFKGTGNLSGSVNITGTATNEPGCSPGRLTIRGNYSQSANTTLQVELGGTEPGVSHDQLVVGGTATLGGRLVTKFVNGFYPAANAAFPYLAAGSRNGAFASFSYPSNDVGMELIYVGTNAAVRVINVRPNLPVIADRTLDELTPFSLAVNATDDDLPMQTLTYALTNPPAGATINSSGVIQWTPTETQGPMTTNLTVRVTDNGTPKLSASRTFQATVREVNVAPQFGSLDDYIANPGQTISFSASATDADLPVNSLAFSLVNPPAGAAIDPNSGLFTWRLPVSRAGSTNTVFVRVADDGLPLLSSAGAFNVVVQPLNPVVLTPLRIGAGEFQFSVSGQVGPDYIFQRSYDLTHWISFLTNTPAALPLIVTDTNNASSNQFYRALIRP